VVPPVELGLRDGQQLDELRLLEPAAERLEEQLLADIDLRHG
jgi:hypothetical protein